MQIALKIKTEQFCLRWEFRKFLLRGFYRSVVSPRPRTKIGKVLLHIFIFTPK